MPRRLHLTTAAILWVAAVGVSAQSAATIPVRPIGPVVAASAPIFATATNIRVLSDGRVLVNETTRRVVLLLDAQLANPRVVIDSVAGNVRSYGASAGNLIAFPGDSTLFVDRTASVFVLLAPDGTVARILALPPGNAATYVGSPVYGAAYSPSLGLVYRLPGATRFPTPPPDGSSLSVGVDDSMHVVAMNLATRAVDTLSRFVMGERRITMSGGMITTMTVGTGALFPVVDQWSVAADGSIALLRARDYRIDWVNADRSRTAGPRIPAAWVRNSDDEKQRIVDSIHADRMKAYVERMAARGKDSADRANGVVPRRGADTAGGRGTAAAGRGSISGTISASAMPVPNMIGPIPNRAGVVGVAVPRPPVKLEVTEVPDYMPSLFGASSVFYADADNRFWIRPRPAKPVPGGPIFDIVDRAGVLVDRVQIPEGRSIIGFGVGGFVYLGSMDGGSAKIEKVRFR